VCNLRIYTYISLTDTWRVAGVLISAKHLAYANIRVHHTHINAYFSYRYLQRSRGLAVSNGYQVYACPYTYISSYIIRIAHVYFSHRYLQRGRGLAVSNGSQVCVCPPPLSKVDNLGGLHVLQAIASVENRAAYGGVLTDLVAIHAW
jgi:hypothetical protein